MQNQSLRLQSESLSSRWVLQEVLIYLFLFDLTFILMHWNILHFKQACTGNISLLDYFWLALLQELQRICLGTYVL